MPPPLAADHMSAITSQSVGHALGSGGHEAIMLPDRREGGCPVLAVTEDGHLAILTELQSNAVLQREYGSASACALGGCLHALRLEDATDSSHNAVPINDDTTSKAPSRSSRSVSAIVVMCRAKCLGSALFLPVQTRVSSARS